MSEVVKQTRNPKLKIMLLVAVIALVINAIVSAYAPTILACANSCEDAQRSFLSNWLIEFGLHFPRIQAYSRLQEIEHFSYPWPVLAWAYGFFWSEFFLGVAITWPIILLDTRRWVRETDFANLPKDTQNPGDVCLALMFAIAITLWTNAFDPIFLADQRVSRTPSFDTNLLPSLAVPGLYLMTSILFGLAIRMAIINVKTAGKKR